MEDNNSSKILFWIAIAFAVVMLLFWVKTDDNSVVTVNSDTNTASIGNSQFRGRTDINLPSDWVPDYSNLYIIDEDNKTLTIYFRDECVNNY